MTQPKINTHTQIEPIDPKLILEHGGSPTSIILAIAILLSILFSSLTCLVYVIIAAKS